MLTSRRTLILLTLTSAITLAARAQTSFSGALSPTTNRYTQTMPTVSIHPGDEVQSIINSHSPGTKYVFSAGVYRLLEMQPHNNDVFVVSGTVVLSGATELINFNHSGSLWYVDGQTQKGQQNGSCLPAFPMCTHPEDLYFDSKPLAHVASLSQVVSGTWYFDYTADRIYFADAPTGHVVETSVARSAFSGQAQNVTITGFIVEKYASPAQMGAIGDQYPGTGWLINENEVRLNHGAGIRASSGASIVHNWVHNNGQIGLGGNGDNILVSGNILSFTGYAGFDPNWEVGGSKISNSHNLVFRSNTAHDNQGTGLWTDIDDVNTLYEYNICYNNTGAGIQHEISWSAIIRYNVAYNNGRGQSVWLWGSQIQVQNSSNVEVYSNRIVVSSTYGNGFGIIHQNRGSGPYGPHVAANNYFHDNDITYEGLTQGISGLVADYDVAVAFNSNNRFDSNHYHVPDTTKHHWDWQGLHTWVGLLGMGQEAHGTLDTDTTAVLKHLPLQGR